MFNNSTQHLVSVATSIVRDRQFSTIHLWGLSLVRGLAQFFELRTNNRMSPRSSTEYGHSGLKSAQRRVPASRYIVAFITNNYRGIPPRSREDLTIAVGQDGDCYAQLKQLYQQPYRVKKISR